MVQLDPALALPTPTGDMADRADAWRIAVRLVAEAGLVADASPEDVLELARFLYDA